MERPSRSRHFDALPPGVFVAAIAAVAVSLAGMLMSCKGAEPECSTLDAAGNPIPSAMGGPAKRDGRAVAPPECAKTKECPKSCICRDLGRCATAEDGRCVVGEASHCKQSRICKLKGFCTLSNGACAAGSDEECAHSDTCRRTGSCKAYGGLCVKEVPP